MEHQLETAKIEVEKPFAQEQELSEKLERLTELNALLNIDEKGDNMVDLGGDEPEMGETGSQSVADSRHERISVKEKLAEMKQKLCGQKPIQKPEITKEKGKEESR